MIGNDWDKKLNKIFETKEYRNLIKKVNNEYTNNICYPKYENIYNAFKLTPYSKVKVVIVGQDPYHGEGQSHGLSFSVQKVIKLPPSLKNIFKELNSDLKINLTSSGDLTKWAKQGVLLLNSVLTVQKDKPASHKNLGWDILTDAVIKLLNEKKDPIVFILWGNFAKSKSELITNKKHHIIQSSHPSPFSARKDFFGSKPFSKTNTFLQKNNYKEIDFSL